MKRYILVCLLALATAWAWLCPGDPRVQAASCNRCSPRMIHA
jgi:hypothetical protein